MMRKTPDAELVGLTIPESVAKPYRQLALRIRIRAKEIIYPRLIFHSSKRAGIIILISQLWIIVIIKHNYPEQTQIF